ncbi:MAG: transglutaminase domain-containing protein [Bacteroidetes bacterium]|nr:transglutaminase domain-containing protein [Bacteroidota bacterium]MBS1671604.1 transglutaminase domain-containing protein [Bacteroidota bacterium]
MALLKRIILFPIFLSCFYASSQISERLPNKKVTWENYHINGFSMDLPDIINKTPKQNKGMFLFSPYANNKIQIVVILRKMDNPLKADFEKILSSDNIIVEKKEFNNNGFQISFKDINSFQSVKVLVKNDIVCVLDIIALPSEMLTYKGIYNRILNSFEFYGISNNQELYESNERNATSYTTAPKINYELTHIDKDILTEFFKGEIFKEKRNVIRACDYNTPIVRDLSVKVAGRDPGSFNLGQICDIFDFLYKNWKYVNDPNGPDYFASASETIGNGYNGDCDDFAIIMCSMILSIGGEARVNTVFDNSSIGHAFAEVNIGKFISNDFLIYMTARYSKYNLTKINYRQDINGNKWLNLDWQAEYPGGKYCQFNSGVSYFILQKYWQKFKN